MTLIALRYYHWHKFSGEPEPMYEIELTVLDYLHFVLMFRWQKD